jgi:hypothetical protein
MKALLRGSGEMADTQVLGTCVFGRAGSSPASRTIISTEFFQLSFETTYKSPKKLDCSYG